MLSERQARELLGELPLLPERTGDLRPSNLAAVLDQVDHAVVGQVFDDQVGQRGERVFDDQALVQGWSHLGQELLLHLDALAPGDVERRARHAQRPPMLVAREDLAPLNDPDPAPILRRDAKLGAVLGPAPVEMSASACCTRGRSSGWTASNKDSTRRGSSSEA